MASCDILDDLWITIFHFLNVKSFVSIQLVCKHFQDLFHNKKYGMNNKYWERASKQLCCSIHPNYSTTEWFTFYLQLKQVIDYVRFCTSDRYTSLWHDIESRINLNTPCPPIYPACVCDCHLIFDMYVSNHSTVVNTPFYDITKRIISTRYDFKYYDYTRHNINTPLLVSIEKNMTNMVKYLLIQPNIELNVHVDQYKSKIWKERNGEYSEYTSPLIVACVYGFYHIAKMLLSHGSMTEETINYIGYQKPPRECKHIVYNYQMEYQNATALYVSLFDIDVGYHDAHNPCIDSNNNNHNITTTDNNNDNSNNDSNDGISCANDNYNYANMAGFSMASTLIKQCNADVNIKYAEGTILQTAVKLYGEQIDQINYLKLSVDTKMGKEKFESDSPGHVYLKNYYLHVIKFLLTDDDCKSKVNIKAMDEYEHPVLHYACAQNLPEIVELLLAHPNCDLFLQSDSNSYYGRNLTTLMIAASRGHINIIQWIGNYISKNKGIKYSSKQINDYINATNSNGQNAQQIVRSIVDKIEKNKRFEFVLKPRKVRYMQTMKVLSNMSNCK